MSKFLTELEVVCLSDSSWKLTSPLRYESDILGLIEVPKGFETDFASVPRMPIFFALFGNRVHREAVLHDALYRIDFPGDVSYHGANRVFLEAMKCRGKPFWIRWPMFAGVTLGGWTAYHKKRVGDRL